MRDRQTDRETGGERERERERGGGAETETDRQRQTDRQTNRDIETQRRRDRDRETEEEGEREGGFGEQNAGVKTGIATAIADCQFTEKCIYFLVGSFHSNTDSDSQVRICSDNCPSLHSETEVTVKRFYHSQLWNGEYTVAFSFT